jgi:hypothetical protein
MTGHGIVNVALVGAEASAYSGLPPRRVRSVARTSRAVKLTAVVRRRSARPKLNASGPKIDATRTCEAQP